MESHKTINKVNKKRKLDESNIDYTENERDRKRSKLNKANLFNKLNKLNKLTQSHKLLQKQTNLLTQQNNQLTKQNNLLTKQNNELTYKSLHYKEGVNIYKNEANIWKSKYNKLYSQLSPFIISNTNNNCNNPISLEPLQFNHTNENICNDKKSKHNNKNKHKTVSKKSKHNNKNNKSKPCSIKNNNKQKNKKYVRSSKMFVDVSFENSYIISINCHLCKKYFNKFDKYSCHLKKHYENDKNKIWLKCDLGCKNNISNARNFIMHIATHTNIRPFRCNISQNGNKCAFTAGCKRNMKVHWNSQHNINSKNNKNKNNKSQYESDEESDYESSLTESYSESECDPFEENGYFVSVNCHICKKNFNDYNKYKEHLQKHYLNDKNRKWLQCDFGCKQKKRTQATAFLCHIASHTMDYPFKCNVMVNGKKCKGKGGTKGNLKSHWNVRHNKTYKKKYESSDSCSDISSCDNRKERQSK